MSNESRQPSASSLVTRHSLLPLSGILNLDKPAGPTSHDIVAQVRRLVLNPSKIQNPKSKLRVGHGGTLDPAATGVLVVLLGAATRLAEYLADLPKEYDARIRFGLRTDTQDTTGTVLSEEDASFLTEEPVRAALAPFRGDILQTPPMVSALKVGGQRLYELARRGESVERVARPVTIHELRLEEFHPGREAWGRLIVACSSGTYVRTLCADLGEALGCGAAMAALRRTAIGPFRLADAVSLEALEQAVAEGRLHDHLLPPAAAVAHLPAVTVNAADRARLLHGVSVVSAPTPATRCAGTRPPPTSGEGGQGVGAGVTTQVMDEKGELIAIGRWEEDRLIPVKVLAVVANSSEDDSELPHAND